MSEQSAGPTPALTVSIRPFTSQDSIEDLTELMHRAYEPLAERGLLYLATHQDAGTTARRIAGGECLLAEHDGRVVGTITWHGPRGDGDIEWYRRPDVATFQQFCVDPGFQGQGIATALLEEVQRRARALGLAELACDTAQSASDLITWYERRGFRSVGEADWRPVTNYRSVILSKAL